MDLDFIERLVGIFERSRLTELDYAEGGARVRIARDAGVPAGPGAQAATRHDAIVPPEAPAGDPPGEADHVVAAGLVGTFHRGPGPDQPPFVSECDLVRDGQTLGILEAMKMLNPIEADRAGRIARVLAEDGASVEAGTPLFTIIPGDGT